jgi:hypothetical protein
MMANCLWENNGTECTCLQNDGAPQEGTIINDHNIQRHCFGIKWLLGVREKNKEEFFLTHIIQHFLTFLLTIEHCELLKKEGMNS